MLRAQCVGEAAGRSGAARSWLERGKRRTWLLVSAVALVVLGAPLVAITYLVRAAARVPNWSPPDTEMPAPNGYQDFLAAGAPVSNQVQIRLLRAKPGTIGPDEQRSLLAAHQESLQRLRLGLTRECRIPFDPTPRGLFELNQFRALTRLLIAEGDLAASEGQFDAAVDSYLDAIRFGTEMPRGGGLVYSYRGLSFQRQGLHALDRLRERLDAPAQARLTARLAALDRRCVRVPETVDCQTEIGSAMLIDVLRWPDPMEGLTAQASQMSTDSVPPMSWRENWELRLTPRSNILQSYRNYMSQLSRDLQQPYSRRPAPRPIPTDPVNQRMMEGSEQFTRFAAWEHRDFNWRMLTTHLAIQRYRSRRGTLPATLKELTPAYLPEVPQDPFAPRPLVYRREGSRYRLYSRGPDGDDDGGQDIPGFAEAKEDGDLVTLRDQ